MNYRTFQKEIWDYYRGNKRNLPWRQTKNSYKILVSEIMLQQTQVSRVLKKYPEFLKAFPNARALAKAPLGNVLRVWQGMGYNRRAIALKKLAEEVVRTHRGNIPLDFESLIVLPGVGRSTAGAVVAFASDTPIAFIETNIRRVFIHFFFKKKSRVSDAEILRLVAKTLPGKNVRPVRSRSPRGGRSRAYGRAASHGVREWYWALMDYGAMLGTKKMTNPNRQSVHYTRQSTFEGSNRQLRGKILNLLVKEKIFSLRQFKQKTGASSAKLRRVLRELRREGFLIKTDVRYALAR